MEKLELTNDQFHDTVTFELEGGVLSITVDDKSNEALSAIVLLPEDAVKLTDWLREKRMHGLL